MAHYYIILYLCKTGALKKKTGANKFFFINMLLENVSSKRCSLAVYCIRSKCNINRMKSPGGEMIFGKRQQVLLD